MEYLKHNDLEKYVRAKLGQDPETPKYHYRFRKDSLSNIAFNTDTNTGGYIDCGDDIDKIIDYNEYIKLSENRKRNCRVEHERINYSACNSPGNDAVHENNKKICEIFKNDLNCNRMVMYVWKGTGYAYLVSNDDYERYNYWDSKYWKSGLNWLDKDESELPYKWGFYMDMEGTVKNLKTLIAKSKEFRPSNACDF